MRSRSGAVGEETDSERRDYRHVTWERSTPVSRVSRGLTAPTGDASENTTETVVRAFHPR